MNFILGKKKSILLIFAALATLMVSSALIELSQSKKEILHIMSEQAHTLLESITIASPNSLRATEYLDVLADRKGLKFDPQDKTYHAYKRSTGFGVLLRNVVSQNPRIIYAALQNTNTILAASGNVSILEAIHESEFLSRSWSDSLFLTQTTQFDSIAIFEAVHPFTYSGSTLGILRIGLSMDPVNTVNQRIYRRLIVITIVLIFIGLIIFTYLFTQQRYALLHRQYTVVETYSGNIINNVSDGVIVTDDQSKITIFNRASEKLFKKKSELVISKPLASILGNSDFLEKLQGYGTLTPIDCVLNGHKRHLLVSRSQFEGNGGKQNTILVIRDLTTEKQLEEQMERKQRMTAMGELASGVAHEIRNPLNTISTIIQQLNKDFEPQESAEEYHQLAGLVHKEVKRINHTVQDFLHFSRPEAVQPEEFSLSTFLSEIRQQFAVSLESGHVQFNLKEEWNGKVYWDPRQMRQVFINLIQNAQEAMTGSNSQILLSIQQQDKANLTIRLSDTGPGISENMQGNIFNLYFTTKASGTGIGLSIVQRIIYEHDGLITVESEKGKGTSFIMQLPIRVT